MAEKFVSALDRVCANEKVKAILADTQRPLRRTILNNLLSQLIKEKETEGKDVHHGGLYLNGKPSLAKTAIIRSLAEVLGAKLIYINCAELVPEALRVPTNPVETTTSNGDKVATYKPGLSKYLFELINDDNELKILFFDELNRIDNPSVANVIFPIINERKVEEKTIKNCLIVAAGNPEGNVINISDPAFSSRLNVLDIDGITVQEWLKWAQTEGNIDSSVVEFITIHNDLLYVYPSEDDRSTANTPIPWPCPRSWEGVSDDIKKYKLYTAYGIPFLVEDLHTSIASYVGQDAATKFMQFYKNKTLLTAAFVGSNESQKNKALQDIINTIEKDPIGGVESKTFEFLQNFDIIMKNTFSVSAAPGGGIKVTEVDAKNRERLEKLFEKIFEVCRESGVDASLNSLVYGLISHKANYLNVISNNIISDDKKNNLSGEESTYMVAAFIKRVIWPIVLKNGGKIETLGGQPVTPENAGLTSKDINTPKTDKEKAKAEYFTNAYNSFFKKPLAQFIQSSDGNKKENQGIS